MSTTKISRREARASMDDTYEMGEEANHELVHLTNSNRKRDHKRELKQAKRLSHAWYTD